MEEFFKMVTETEKLIKKIKQRFIENAVRLGIELWQPIDGYDKYEVSTFGRVRSNYKNGKTKTLSLRKNTNNYYQVSLCRDSYAKNFDVHRLVAQTFIPNPEGKKCVDHKNNNRLDNNINNLRWATVAENQYNRSITKTKTSGTKGVYYNKPTHNWRALITINGISKHLGLFDDIEDAIKARREASKKYFGEYQNKCEQ